MSKDNNRNNVDANTKYDDYTRCVDMIRNSHVLHVSPNMLSRYFDHYTFDSLGAFINKFSSLLLTPLYEPYQRWRGDELHYPNNDGTANVILGCSYIYGAFMNNEQQYSPHTTLPLMGDKFEFFWFHMQSLNHLSHYTLTQATSPSRGYIDS